MWNPPVVSMLPGVLYPYSDNRGWGQQFPKYSVLGYAVLDSTALGVHQALAGTIRGLSFHLPMGFHIVSSGGRFLACVYVWGTTLTNNFCNIYDKKSGAGQL